MGKVYQRAVLWCPGIIFPTPYPQGYGPTPPLPRPPQSACDVPRSMPEAAADGNAGCVVHRGRPTGGRYRVTGRGGHPSATEPHHRVTTRRVTTAPNHRAAPGSGAAPAPAPPDRPTVPVTTADRSATGVVRRAVFSRLPEPAALVAYSTSAGDAGRPRSRPRGSAPPPAASCSAGPNAWPPTGPRGRTRAVVRRGRAPVKRLNPAHATVYFQPTSHPCRFLGELADQPPCHQARRDHAVRFHPIGTGHEREAHFPARPGGGTLRDRMLPAKWPCRHSAGWSTCHDGATRRSRFDLECRRLGTRARPRGNVQERQARKDQEDANTEGA